MTDKPPPLNPYAWTWDDEPWSISREEWHRRKAKDRPLPEGCEQLPLFGGNDGTQD